MRPTYSLFGKNKPTKDKSSKKTGSKKAGKTKDAFVKSGEDAEDALDDDEVMFEEEEGEL